MPRVLAAVLLVVVLVPLLGPVGSTVAVAVAAPVSVPSVGVVDPPVVGDAPQVTPGAAVAACRSDTSCGDSPVAVVLLGRVEGTRLVYVISLRDGDSCAPAGPAGPGPFVCTTYAVVDARSGQLLSVSSSGVPVNPAAAKTRV